jgi:hypothetical protein
MPCTRRAFLQSGAAAALVPLVDPGLSLAAGRTRPNILLVIIDTLRADHVSAYARTDVVAFVSSNRGRGQVGRQLHAAVVGRAGGRLPTYH